MTRVPACCGPLESANAKYTALAWHKDAAGVSCCRENDHAKDEDASVRRGRLAGRHETEPKKSTYDFATRRGNTRITAWSTSPI